MNILRRFLPLILITSAFTGDIRPACREFRPEPPQKRRKLNDDSDKQVVSNSCFTIKIFEQIATFLSKKDKATLAAACRYLHAYLGDVPVIENFYVTPQIFFDNKAFECFLKFVAKHQELKEIVFLPALPVYGKEDVWERFFVEGDEHICYSSVKLPTFDDDWYRNLSTGWLDKFNRLCKQVPVNTKIYIGLFIPQKNATVALEKIKQMSFGRQIISQNFDYSPIHMVLHENNEPVYIFEIPTTFQGNYNFWECGYYTVFNACILHNVLSKINETSPHCLYRLNLKRSKAFEEFYQALGNKYPDVVLKRKQQERLHFRKGMALFDAVFSRKIEETPNVLLIVQDGGLSTQNYDYNCKYLMTRKSFSAEKPILVIFKSWSHWNCFVFTKTAIFIADSTSAIKYAHPKLLINLYRYLITQSQHIFETKEAAAGTDNPLIYFNVRDLYF